MKKIIKIIGSFFILTLLFLYYNFFSSYIFPWQEKEAITTTLNWGGLAKLPNEMEDFSIRKSGSLFTRSFKIEFDASQKEIENWISNSKRLHENKPTVSGTTKIYLISPGENESFGGTVIVENNSVKINMSWS